MRQTQDIRNIALVGHHGSGKTSLAEALLYRAGVINRLGVVEQGTTVLDHDDEEHAHQQSISLSVASFDWAGHRINLIDTPGSPDFRGEALLGLTAADLAVFVIDGVSGVQAQDVALWREAAAQGTPRIVFVNKLDRERSSFDRTLAQVREAFGSGVDPAELPIGEESAFHGITDVLTHHAFIYDSGSAEEVEVPGELVDAERAEHEHLVEDVVELDDDALEQYLSGEEPGADELDRLLHDAVDQAMVFPVLCGSATTPIGADQLADFVCRVGPAPGDAGPAIGTGPAGPIEVTPDPDGPPIALVVKTTIDEYVGQISICRLLSGTVRTDDVLLNSRTGDTERLHHLLSLSGSTRSSIDSVGAGDVFATTKLADTRTGDTLAAVGTRVAMATPTLPTAVYAVGIEAVKQSDEDRLATMLRRLLAEDPTLDVHHESSTGQTLLGGCGETHVRVALSRIARAGIELEVEDARVAYRETLAGSIEVEGKHKKQSGGHGQFGVATVRFEPLPHGLGFDFDDEVTGGAIPKNLIPAVGLGIEESMRRGGRHGFPMVDVGAVCTGGKTHSVDSSEMAFKMAGAHALRSAIDEVGVQVLEPVSEIRVRVPSELHGEILGDLNSRRAQIKGNDIDGDVTTIEALVPSAEVVRYAIDLRSISGGSGTFEVSHHGYQPLPDHLLDSVVKAANERIGAG